MKPTTAELLVNQSPLQGMERRLRPKHVCELAGVKKSYLYQMIRDGDFPPPLKDGKISFWPASEVEQWVRDSIANAERGVVPVIKKEAVSNG